MPNTLRVKRRSSGTGVAPSTLKSAELAFCEVLGNRILYYGLGDDGSGNATSVIAIGGPDAFVTASSNNTFTGTTTFSNSVTFSSTSVSFAAGYALPATNGGTGQTSYTTGDLLYASSTTAVGKLNIGTNGQVLTSSGTAPQWSAASSLSVGSATTSTTATNVASGSAGNVLYQSGASTTSFVTNGTSGQVLTSNGSSAPSWASSLTLSSLIISGNLTVQGTTTTVDSTTVNVADKNITLGNVASPTDATADGGGITLKGTTDKTFNWVDSNDSWTSSEHLNLATGKEFRVNGTTILSGTALSNVDIDGGTY
jgi:hypothetical protein